MVYYDFAKKGPHFIDLSDKQDDKRILRNPHKGWGFHYIDNGYQRPIYRNTLREGDDLLHFPYLNHIYLRFDWCDIESEEGVYDWSYIDEIMDKWGKFGYRFSLRLCTYEGLDDNIYYATPKWVYDKGAKFHDNHGIIEPVYDDPIFLYELEKVMAEFGRKFDGDPRVEFVDVGSFGDWGEGHVGDGTIQVYDNSVMIKHIELTLKYFQKTYVLVNTQIPRHPTIGAPDADQFAILDYCAEHGCGLREDSVLLNYTYKEMDYTTLIQPKVFDSFYKIAPIELEYAHMYHANEENYRGGFTCEAALERSHATYMVYHGDPYEWLERYYDATVYAGARMGYWYFPEGIVLPESVSGLASYADITFSNRAYGIGHFDGELEFKLRSEGGQVFSLGRTAANNRTWMPGEASTVRAKLDFKNVPEGNYQLSVGLYEGDRAIQLAAFEKSTEDDCLIIDNITVR